MAVVTVTSFTAAPGKAADAQAQLKEGLGIWSRFGGKGGVYSLVRGGVIGTLNIVVEFADPLEYGAALDRIYADPAWEAFIARGQLTQALVPARSVAYTEVAGLEVPHAEIASCGVAVATLFQVRHGKQTQSLERIRQVKAISERYGGKMRALQSVVSDPFGVSATVVYYPNFTAWAKAGVSAAADPEWQALGAEIMGEQSSSDILRSSLMRLV